METQTGNRRTIPRPRTLAGRRHGDNADAMRCSEADIVCQYGVVVQHTSVAGMELVEFEFLPDAA